MAIGTYANYLQKLILTLNGLRSSPKSGSLIAKAVLVRSFRNLCENRKISSDRLAFCLCLMELHEYITRITSRDGLQMYCITKLGNEKLDKAFAVAAKIPGNFRAYRELQTAMDFLPFEDAIRNYMKRMTEKALQQARHGEDVSMRSASVEPHGVDYEDEAMDIDSPSIDYRALSVQSYPSPPGTPRVGRGTPVDVEGYTSHESYRSLSPLTELSGSRGSSMRPTPTPQNDREKLGLLRNERTMKQTLMLRRRAGLLDKRHVSQPSSSNQDDDLNESRTPLGSPWSGSLRSSQSLSSLRSANRYKRQPTFSPTISELFAIQERRENRESSAGFTPPPSHGRDTPSMWIPKVEEEDEDYGLWDGQDGLVTPRAESYSFTPRSSSYASEGEYQASLGEVIIPATPTYSVTPSCDSQTPGSVSEQSEQSEVEDMLVGSNGERPGARARARSPPLSPRSPRAFSPPPYPSTAAQRGLAKKLSREFRRVTSHGELRGRDMPSAIQASSSGVRGEANPTAANVAVGLDNAGLGPTRTSRGRTRADDYLDDIRQQEELARMRPKREPSTAPSESDFVPSEAPTSPRGEIFGLGLDLGERAHSPRERELRRCMSQPDIIGASHANGNGSAHVSIRGSRSPSVLSFDSNWHSSWTGTPSGLGQGTEHQTMSFGLAGQLTGAPGVGAGAGAGAALTSTTPQFSPFSSGHSPQFEFEPPREASEGPFVDLALRGRVPSANHGMTTDSEACPELDMDEGGQVDFSDHSSISATPRSSTSFRALSSVSCEERPFREGGIARLPVHGQEQELLLQTSLPTSAVDSPAVFNRLMFQTLQKVEEMVSIWDRVRADMDNGEDEDQFGGEVEHGNAAASLYDFQEADREAERVQNPDTTLSIESGFQAGVRSLIDDSELAADFASLSNQKKGLVYLAKEIDKLRAEVRVLKDKARLGLSPAGRAEETKGGSAWIAKELLRLAQVLTQE